MKNNVILKEFEINTTPLEKIKIDTYAINIFLDDIYEQRYKITIKPYQAFKVVTIDCVSSKEYYNEYCFRDGRYHRHIIEIGDSLWKNELINGLSDRDANFMHTAKHYALPLQDIMIEFIANEFIITKEY